MSARIKVEQVAAIATVTIVNPEKHNALTRAMWLEMKSAFETLSADAHLLAVVIRGAGEAAFSAGADISEFEETRGSFAQVVDFHENVVGAALQAIASFPVPVVAQIAGACMGGGLEIACVCDLRIAGESARLGAPVARLGFPLAMGETEALFALAGAAVTAELLLEGRVYYAREAAAKGLLTRVVADTDVESEAQAAAQRIAEMGPWATRSHKRQIRRLSRDPSPVTLDERMAVYAFAETEDYRIGYRAFLDKRKPQFSGK